MHWDRLFEDLEDQLASEHDAARAALDTEAERLRISRIPLRARLLTLSEGRQAITLRTAGLDALVGIVHEVGADWLGLHQPEWNRLVLVPLAAVSSLSAASGVVLESLNEASAPETLRARMSLGFVLRDLARKRMPVTVTTVSGDALHGTVDRAGADHLDLALHPLGEHRRAHAVTGIRMIPFHAVGAVAIGDRP